MLKKEITIRLLKAPESKLAASTKPGLAGPIVLGVLWFLAFMCVVGAVESAFSQGPVPTPDPTVTALEKIIQAQQLKIDGLTQNLELSRRELSLARAEINNDLNRRLLPVSIVGILIVLVGISSAASVFFRLREIEKSVLAKVEASFAEKATKLQDSLTAKLEELLPQQMQVQITKHLQHIDPTNVPVYVPRNGFQNECERLKKFGFHNLKFYDELDETCLNGCVVVRLTDDPHAVDKFERFVDAHHPNANKVGYLFYHTGEGQFPRNILALHEVTDYCTSITTLSPNVLTIARSLGDGPSPTFVS